MNFSSLSKQDEAQLESNYNAFKRLIKSKYNYELKGNYDDIYYIQQLIDEKYIKIKSEKDDNFYILQGLGLAVGNILMLNEKKFRYCWVEDKYGKDIVLRLGDDKFIINIINLIGFKYVDKKDIDIKFILSELIKLTNKFKKEK